MCKLHNLNEHPASGRIFLFGWCCCFKVSMATLIGSLCLGGVIFLMDLRAHPLFGWGVIGVTALKPNYYRTLLFGWCYSFTANTSFCLGDVIGLVGLRGKTYRIILFGWGVLVFMGLRASGKWILLFGGCLGPTPSQKNGEEAQLRHPESRRTGRASSTGSAASCSHQGG